MGSVIELLSRRRYDFSNGYAQVPLLPVIDSRRFRTGQLQVRLHSNGLVSASTLGFSLYPTLPSAEQPEDDFWGSTAVATVQLNSSSTVPGLHVDDLTSGFGSVLSLWLEGTPSGGGCIAIVSAQLVLVS